MANGAREVNNVRKLIQLVVCFKPLFERDDKVFQG